MKSDMAVEKQLVGQSFNRLARWTTLHKRAQIQLDCPNSSFKVHVIGMGTLIAIGTNCWALSLVGGAQFNTVRTIQFILLAKSYAFKRIYAMHKCLIK